MRPTQSNTKVKCAGSQATTDPNLSGVIAEAKARVAAHNAKRSNAVASGSNYHSKHNILNVQKKLFVFFLSPT